jgi:GNAT superfamily N-acetyltransferase
MIEIARQDGLKVLWFQALGETVYRRLAIYQRRLDETLEIRRAKIPLRVGRLTESDLVEYERLRPDVGGAEALTRLRGGQICWVAWIGEQIVGEIWANPGSGWIEYLECELPLAPGQVYVHQNFTSKDFRHQGISGVLLTTARRDLRENGYRETIGVIRPDKAKEQMPATHETGRIGYWRIGRWRRYFLRWFEARTPGSSTAAGCDSVAPKTAGEGG